MANKNRIRITYPSSEKIYIPGKIHKINVGMRKIKILDTVTRDENGELVHKKNNPVIVYDTSGPYSDPKIPVNTQNGIPRIRESWYAGRKDLIRLEELTSDYGRQRRAVDRPFGRHRILTHVAGIGHLLCQYNDFQRFFHSYSFKLALYIHEKRQVSHRKTRRKSYWSVPSCACRIIA